MKLKQLLKGIDVGEVKGTKEVEITGISADSRTLVPGNLFLAKKGTCCDGNQFIQQAIQAGAAVIVTDIYDPFLKLTQIIHPRVAEIEGKLAAQFFGHPSDELLVVGVTGTKGKTTTSYLVKHLLDGLGKKSGLIGTVETVVGESRFFSKLTTHDAISNQKLLREMVMKGCSAAVLEVSSHGLAQGRVDEIDFDIAIFTNLYPDHLDYHLTIEEYGAAKRKLFSKAKAAVVNADNSWSPFMTEGFKGPIIRFGLEKEAELRASAIHYSTPWTEFLVSYKEQSQIFRSRLIGRFNVTNMLGAIGVGILEGATLAQMAEHFLFFQNVPGRLESVENRRGISVFVDYAHNGEALENVLKALREVACRKVLVVFGCGGNRDPVRRLAMAQAAESFADEIVITSDNPRQEDPHEIIRQILSGFRDQKKVVLVEPDRKKAIEQAIAMAAKDDIVLIAGKGHERMQIFAHQTIPFDDVLVAKSSLICDPESLIR